VETVHNAGVGTRFWPLSTHERPKQFIQRFDDRNLLQKKQGTLMKILRDDNNGKTIVLKVPKNFKMEPHSHVYTEQHFVLKGSYMSEGRVFPEGSFQIYSPKEGHGPFESKDGALILVIWDGIKTD
jgi:anti-sigma factor ChrR (cupin superfamily)